jgi:cyclopropane fatty-acyl-phospholipid synthase-like methyltransferase
MTREQLRQALTLPAFPLSAKYDPVWMITNDMGPSSVWLAEYLCAALDLRPGMRVLDLGCGKAMSSIFLAKEFGVEVWAADLWIDPSDNWQRIVEAGAGDRVYPVHAEAHALPFAKGFFDAMVSIDAYHYFGTSELYLGRFARLARPGAQIGIVVPGLLREFADDGAPAHLLPHWDPQWYSFHSPAWWARLWSRSGVVDVEVADTMPDGHQVWLHWERTAKASGLWGRGGDIELLEADRGERFTFTRVVARRR